MYVIAENIQAKHTLRHHVLGHLLEKRGIFWIVVNLVELPAARRAP